MSQESPRTVFATVYSDYICPFCYIGDLRLDRVREEVDLRINWRLVEIHPETPPEGRPRTELGYDPDHWHKLMASLDQLAAEEGVTLAPPERTADSRRALLLAEAAKEDGAEVFYPLHRGLFEAYFLAGQDIGCEEALRRVAAEAGVSEATLERAWTDPAYPRRLQDHLAAAREAGITGTPTFSFGDRRLVGAQPAEVLLAAAREAAASRSAAGPG